MEILETIPIMVCRNVFPILCIAFLMIGIIDCVLKDLDALGVICFIGFLVCLILGAATQKPSERNQYLVKINEDYPIAKVVKQYDIVEVRNADTGLYLLEDKKD